MSTGEVRANGVQVASPQQFSQWGTVAPQDDVVLPSLTVFESLHYAAQLRGSKEGRIEALLATFELNDRRELAAGKLSGGQQKRLSIAMELIHAPSVILIDEPTSGLDSRVAFQVINTLRDLVRVTRTNVAVTIHQPSLECFLCFDRLLLLTAGRVAFCGSVNKALAVFQDVVSIDGFGDLPRNPADSAIDLAADVDAAVAQWHRIASEDTEFNTTEQQRLNQLKVLDQSNDLSVVSSGKSSVIEKPSHIRRFVVLFERTMLQTYRMQGTFQLRSAILTSIIYGLAFFQEQNTQGRAKLKAGVLFLSCILNGFIPGISTALFVPLERATLRREAWNGVWRLPEYLAARFLAASVIQVCCVSFYCIIVYFMVDLRGTFLGFEWPFILLGLVTQQFGFALGTIFTSAVVSVPAFLPINVTAAIFGGFFFQKNALTKTAQKVTIPLWSVPRTCMCVLSSHSLGASGRYFSWYRYVFALILTNEFADGRFSACDVDSGDNCPYSQYADFSGQRHVRRKVVAIDEFHVNMAFARRRNGLILLAFFAGMCTGKPSPNAHTNLSCPNLLDVRTG